MNEYEDILHLPHPVSGTHPQMSMHDRAAQFSPVAALSGYEEAVEEEARLTEEKILLDEYEKQRIDDKLQKIRDDLQERGKEEKPRISVTYFLPDQKKAGGSYVTVTGQVKKLDTYRQQLLFTDGSAIPFQEIIELEGDLFLPKNES